MDVGDYFYAIVREYRSPRGNGFAKDERIVRVGTREEDVVVRNSSLFKDPYKNIVARLEYYSRDNGGIWGTIEDCFEGRSVFSFVPLDDIVEDSGIVTPN